MLAQEGTGMLLLGGSSPADRRTRGPADRRTRGGANLSPRRPSGEPIVSAVALHQTLAAQGDENA